MTRRRWIRSLAAGAAVAAAWAGSRKRVRRPDLGSISYTNLDGMVPRVAVVDKYCPAGKPMSFAGILIMSADVVKRHRFGKPDTTIGMSGVTYQAWSLA